MTVLSGGWPGVITGDGISGTGITDGDYGAFGRRQHADHVSFGAGRNGLRSRNPCVHRPRRPRPPRAPGSRAPAPSRPRRPSSPAATPPTRAHRQQALIDAGLPFCLEEFETTGSGPSATQVAVEYAGQNVPTSQAPTVALSSSSGSIGQQHRHHRRRRCMSGHRRGGHRQPSSSVSLFSGTNNCWYARAGDSTPVSVTVDGNPATVTPNPTTSTVTNVAVTSGSEVATITARRYPPPSRPTSLVTWYRSRHTRRVPR